MPKFLVRWEHRKYDSTIVEAKTAAEAYNVAMDLGTADEMEAIGECNAREEFFVKSVGQIMKVGA